MCSTGYPSSFTRDMHSLHTACSYICAVYTTQACAVHNICLRYKTPQDLPHNMMKESMIHRVCGLLRERKL